MNEENENPPHKKRKFRWLRRIARMLLGILIFLILLLLFIRSPWGQSIIIDYAVSYVKDKTGTEVQLESAFITFDGDIKIEGLYLADTKNDTLVYSKSLEANIAIMPLINNSGFEIDDVEWDGLTAKIKRADTTSGFNYQFLMDAFATAPDTTTTSDPMQIKIGEISLTNFDILYQDQIYEMDASANFEELYLQMNEIDLGQMIVDVELLTLKNAIIDYVNLLNTSTEFEQIKEDNAFLESSFEQQFISGLTYSFTYNGMLSQSRKGLFYVNSTVDVAGNSISLLSSENDLGQSEFLGLEYAQYAKADVDLRFHYLFGNESRIATRFFAGYGLPYGNSDVLPFSKQYFSGGAYSVRAFRTRSLGPGTYSPENTDDRSFFDQSGNVRLEANIEYRFPIYSYFKGALFVDAGNVWTTAGNGLEGGEFGSNFYNELGIGAGLGMRVDVQGFVIRFDLAAPWHDPSLPENERWNFDVANPVFNFAIGYPF